MALGSGLGGMVDEVPAGWAYETILVAGAEGVTRTMLAWGDAQQREPEALDLPRDEVEEVAAVLGATTALLPPSARVWDGLTMGFLPFLDGPPRVIDDE
jgi:hypothetical protein